MVCAQEFFALVHDAGAASDAVCAGCRSYMPKLNGLSGSSGKACEARKTALIYDPVATAPTPFSPAPRPNIGSCSLTTVKLDAIILPIRQRVRPEAKRKAASIGSSLRLQPYKMRHFAVAFTSHYVRFTPKCVRFTTEGDRSDACMRQKCYTLIAEWRIFSTPMRRYASR